MELLLQLICRCYSAGLAELGRGVRGWRGGRKERGRGSRGEGDGQAGRRAEGGRKEGGGGQERRREVCTTKAHEVRMTKPHGMCMGWVFNSKVIKGISSCAFRAVLAVSSCVLRAVIRAVLRAASCPTRHAVPWLLHALSSCVLRAVRRAGLRIVLRMVLRAVSCRTCHAASCICLQQGNSCEPPC